MLSDRYNQLFTETLQSFAQSVSSSRDSYLVKKKFSLFYPSLGKNYLDKRKLLVVGQATNGWHPKWFVNDVASQRDNIVAESIDNSSEEEGKCPLDWINEEWSKWKLFRSFFWNVTYKIVKAKYHRTDTNWNHIIAWSNLIKIAPADHGNPNETERQFQLDHCAKLFRQELDELKPQNVLIITNLVKWAEPVLKRANIHTKKVEGNYIEAIGQYADTKIIVTKRPFFGRHKTFVDEIGNELQ